MNAVPKGAKGRARLRERTDPLYPHLQSRRPEGEDASRWMCYRTEALLAYHDLCEEAQLLRAEYEAAVAELERLRPDLEWRWLLQPGDTVTAGGRTGRVVYLVTTDTGVDRVLVNFGDHEKHVNVSDITSSGAESAPSEGDSK